MSRLVYCVRYHQELPGLDFAPYPGELGQRLYVSVSAQAWQDWLAHQTLLINENRLSPIEPKTKAMLREALEQYFFGENAAQPPPGFTPPQ